MLDRSREQPLALDDTDRRLLTRWSRSPTTPQRLALRSRIVLLASSDRSDAEISAELGVQTRTVIRWRRRFLEGGADALVHDAPGRGRKPGADPAVVAQVMAMHSKRPPDCRSWSVRALSSALGIGRSTVHRILLAEGFRWRRPAAGDR